MSLSQYVCAYALDNLQSLTFSPVLSVPGITVPWNVSLSLDVKLYGDLFDYCGVELLPLGNSLIFLEVCRPSFPKPYHPVEPPQERF